MPENSNKETLAALEREGLYVFHGSGVLLEQLEPKQAYDYSGGEQKKDGHPAVFATQFADYAIFMALINPINCWKSVSSNCSYENGELKFGASKDTLEQLSEATTGYVHVLHRSDFEQRNGCDWFSYFSVKPALVIQIKRSDFRQRIQLIDRFDRIF